MKTVLTPIDFSVVSSDVIREAVALARAINGRLVILHVVQPPPVSEADMGLQMSIDYAARASESAARKLRDLQVRLQAGAVTVQTAHLVGFPGHAIVEQAAKLAADYIVLGSHGHGAFYELIVGSTTSRVLKHAKCPVIVVPLRMSKTGKSKAGARRKRA